LQNEKFVNNAKPEVIAMERKKEADALARIATIESALNELS
jgi:valyl-tRNA synthetase